jgi:hypothetical protein
VPSVGYDVWGGEKGNTGGVVVMWFECMGEGVTGDSAGGGVGANGGTGGGEDYVACFFFKMLRKLFTCSQKLERFFSEAQEPSSPRGRSAVLQIRFCMLRAVREP